MTHTWLAGAAGAAMLAGTALAHPAGHDVADELRGKLCTTRGGNYLHFAADGHYAYDGLWRDGGHYAIRPGAVTITLNNGLQRSFPISRRDGVLFIGQTALSCEVLLAQVAERQ